MNVDWAPQSTDGAGDVVVYVPEQMSDGRMNTAWRCNGNGLLARSSLDFRPEPPSPRSVCGEWVRK